MSRVCPSCHTENPRDRDFCVKCNTYLRWEATRTVEAVGGEPRPPPTPPTPTPTPDPRPRADDASVAARPAADPGTARQAPPATHRPGRVLLALRKPTDEQYATGPLEVGVDPGGQATVVALVRNQDTIVDNYDLTVSGLPADWVTIDPPSVHLLPFAGGDGYEQEVQITLHPPRRPEAEARDWPVRVKARSHAHGRTVARTPLQLTIGPFRQLSARVTPERASGRRKGVFALAVLNRGNAAEDVVVSGDDQDADLRYDVRPRQLTPAIGQQAMTQVTVRPRRPLWLGRPIERPLTILTRPLAPADAEPLRSRAILRQKPWIPRAALLLLPLLAIAAVAVWLLVLNRADVPNLRGLNGEFRAAQVLKAKGLELGRVERQLAPKRAPGTVINQEIPPGRTVRKGTAVGILLALGTTDARVPDVRRRPVPVAQQRLDEAGFQVGQLLPADVKDPEHALVDRQVPAPGAHKRKGSPVTLYLAQPKPAPHGPKTDVAAVGGLGAAAAAASLTRAGFQVAQSDAISASVPKGKVIRQVPAAKESLPKGSTVRLVVSAGYPRVAYDDGSGNVIIADPVTGKYATVPGGPGGGNTEPAWGPGGAWIAYRRGTTTQGQIMRVDLARPANPQPVTEPGHDDSRPAVSPNGDVIAFVRSDGPDGQATPKLCLAHVSVPTLRSTCLKAGGSGVGRPVWAPDGRSILALAADDQNQVEVVRFVSARPNSARKHDWSLAESLTDAAHGQSPTDVVSSVAQSPTNPPQVALAANWQSPSASVYRVLVGPVAAGSGLGQATPVGAALGCDVAWRPDGRELVVAARSDCTTQTPGEIRIIDLNGAVKRTMPTPGESPAFEPITRGP